MDSSKEARLHMTVPYNNIAPEPRPNSWHCLSPPSEGLSVASAHTKCVISAYYSLISTHNEALVTT